jgi:hypothetical protein
MSRKQNSNRLTTDVGYFKPPAYVKPCVKRHKNDATRCARATSGNTIAADCSDDDDPELGKMGADRHSPRSVGE